jgi:hypothetical protein
MSKDEEQLRLLSIFYFIFGGLSVFGVLIGLLYVGIGLAMTNGAIPAGQGAEPPPPALGWAMVGMGAVLAVFSLLYAIGMIIAGRRLRQQRSYVLCMVMAGISCISVPIGTILGIFTIVVLGRDSVKALYKRKKAESLDFAGN